MCAKYRTFLNWLIKFGWAFIYTPSFLYDLQRLWWYCANVQSRLILHCSHMRQIPKFFELAHNIGPEPSSTSLLFSAIPKASGDTAQICSLVWSFPVWYRLCDKYQTRMNWPINREWVWSGSTTNTHFRSTHVTVRKSHRTLIVGRQLK